MMMSLQAVARQGKLKLRALATDLRVHLYLRAAAFFFAYKKEAVDNHTLSTALSFV